LPRQLIVCPYLRSHADNICTGTTTFIGASKGMTPSDAPLQVNPTGVDPNDVLFSVWTSGSNYVLVGDQGSLEATGVIQAGTNALPAAYSRIGPGTATWGAITDSNDMLVTDDLEVGGNIYWGDATRYYAVTASDFQADHEHIWGFYRTATTLEKDSGDLNEQGWYAPIHLPHFATVTMFTVYYYDNSASDLTFELRRRTYGFALAGETMAQVATSLTPGETYGADSTIDNAQILNNSYNYYIYFVFPAADTGSSLAFRNARITYTTARP
jgi:hypothetical protein